MKKYYGIEEKKKTEDREYRLSRLYAQRYHLFLFHPEKKKRLKEHFSYIWRDNPSMFHYNNGIPEGNYYSIDRILIADLVPRDKLDELIVGIKWLYKNFYSNRFLPVGTDSIADIEKKLQQMDSTLGNWYENMEFFTFDLSGIPLSKTIDQFICYVANINPSYLSVEFVLNLTEPCKKEFEDLMEQDFKSPRGYASKAITQRKNTNGFRENTTLVHYNESALKSDHISEKISRIKWEFFSLVKKEIPLYLHCSGIEPPGIVFFNTDISYHDCCHLYPRNIDRNKPCSEEFFASVGIDEINGEFFDERSKLFFDVSLSGRYSRNPFHNMYFVSNELIENQFSDMNPGENLEVYYFCKDESYKFFRVEFLRILNEELGKQLITSRSEIEKIKPRKRNYKKLLQIRLNYISMVEPYLNYYNDQPWEQNSSAIFSLFSEAENLIQHAMDRYPRSSAKAYTTYPISESKRLMGRVNDVKKIIDTKTEISSAQTDYSNQRNSWILNVLMFLISFITLFFVVFPDNAESLNAWLLNLWDFIRNLWKQ